MVNQDKGRLPRWLLIWCGVAMAALAFAGLSFAAWRVPDPNPPWAQHHTKRDWQSATASDCPVMAAAFKAFPLSEYDPHARLGAAALPLESISPNAGPCDWRTYNLNFTLVTEAEVRAGFAAEATGKGHYVEHYRLSRPSYSLLRLRAAVAVAHAYHGLDAYGGTCWLHRSLGGWRVEKCERTWIA